MSFRVEIFARMKTTRLTLNVYKFDGGENVNKFDDAEHVIKRDEC